MRSQSDMGRHLRTSAVCGGGPSRIHADGTGWAPLPTAGGGGHLWAPLRESFSQGGEGDLTFPQVEGLDARGIALASPTPAARLRDNPARALRETRGAPIYPYGLKRSEWPPLFCILIRIVMHIYVCYNETHTSRKGCEGQHGITCAAPAAKSHAISLLGRRRRWIARPYVHLIFYELNANDSHPASTN